MEAPFAPFTPILIKNSDYLEEKENQIQQQQKTWFIKCNNLNEISKENH